MNRPWRTEEPEGDGAGPTLDPSDWDRTRALAHRMIDDAFDDLRTVRDRPVWTKMPDEVAATFEGPAPRTPLGAEAAYAAFRERVVPYRMGNDHPRFWAYYMGSGTVIGALAEFLAAIDASNLGGTEIGAARVERQVLDWCKEMIGLPKSASGVMTSGASVANLIGAAVARHAHVPDVRVQGIGGLREPLVAYASGEVHSCHARSLELMGHGSRALHPVATDEAFRIDVAALRRAVAHDRAAGRRPWLVVATAGTVNTGAFDDLHAVADLCAEEGLWFHVDAAIGAPYGLSARLRPKIAGIERADSVALDLHKGLHAPFEAGAVLVRDEVAHREAFSVMPPYLARSGRGLAGRSTWLSEYGPQLTRGFKALKVWMGFLAYGTDGFARVLERNADQARHLAARVDASPVLERVAPVEADIVCLRVLPEGADRDAIDAANRTLVDELQEEGDFVPSGTTLRGRPCIRVALCNHRTRPDDLDRFVTRLERAAAPAPS